MEERRDTLYDIGYESDTDENGESNINREYLELTDTSLPYDVGYESPESNEDVTSKVFISGAELKSSCYQLCKPFDNVDKERKPGETSLMRHIPEMLVVSEHVSARSSANIGIAYSAGEVPSLQLAPGKGGSQSRCSDGPQAFNTSPSWNEQFQSAMDLDASNKNERVSRLSRIRAVTKAFEDKALSTGRVLIKEWNIPPDDKSIKPIEIGGIAGGTSLAPFHHRICFSLRFSFSSGHC